MGISHERVEELEKTCNDLRIQLINVLHDKQTGHPGGSMSICEILTYLFLEESKITKDNYQSEDRDRIILSKGHAAPMLYLLLEKVRILKEGEINDLRQINTRLQGHPCMLETPGVELTAGPLGMGLSASVGMALALRLNENPANVYCILGDGELNEGMVWEGAMAANKYKLDHLIAILDANGVQLDGTTDEIMPMPHLRERFESFGFKVLEMDGHDFEEIDATIQEAKQVTGQPVVIIAHTVKGKGVSFMEGQSAWHGKAIDDDHYEQAIAELERK